MGHPSGCAPSDTSIIFRTPPYCGCEAASALATVSDSMTNEIRARPAICRMSTSHLSHCQTLPSFFVTLTISLSYNLATIHPVDSNTKHHNFLWYEIFHPLPLIHQDRALGQRFDRAFVDSQSRSSVSGDLWRRALHRTDNLLVSQYRIPKNLSAT